LPIISRSGSRAGLYYAFGFSSSGMINGASAGRAVADLVEGAKPSIDLEPFSIGRFAGRRAAGRLDRPVERDQHGTKTASRA